MQYQTFQKQMMNYFILVASLYDSPQCFIIPLSQHIPISEHLQPRQGRDMGQGQLFISWTVCN